MILAIGIAVILSVGIIGSVAIEWGVRRICKRVGHEWRPTPHGFQCIRCGDSHNIGDRM